MSNTNDDSLPQQQPKKEWTMKPSEMTDWMEQVSSQALDQLHRFAHLEQATTTVLEVGAGRGTYSVRALERMPVASAKLLLTDASTEMVAELQKLVVAADNNDPRLVVQHVNAVELPLPTASVDSYLANLVLHHMSDPVKGLSEALRVLKPGGRLCLTEVDAAASGSLFRIPKQALELAGIVNQNNGGNHGSSAHSHAHHHHHEHHAHSHEHATESKSNNADDESSKQPYQNGDQHHGHHHNHQHAMRHGGVEDVIKMVREAGFVKVVAWHFDCIAETVDATRFAKFTYQRLRSKGEVGDDVDSTQQQRVQMELTRLAQEELDAGRPISFGTIILTAVKPSL